MRGIVSFAVLTVVAGALALTPGRAGRAAELAPQDTERVAATVNQDAITVHDLDARVRLNLFAANIPSTYENRQRMAGDTLRQLIDDHLEVQEATRLKIEVGDTEVANGISDLEAQNKLPKGKLIPMMEENGIDPQALRDQIRAQLAWSQTVRSQLIHNVRIGEEEIDARMAKIRDGMTHTAFLAADIYLPVDDPRHEDEVKLLADKLALQLRNGAPFSALAHQFSAAGAAEGGDLGWISRGMIDDQLFDTLAQLEVGHASVPIRTADGYHIVLLRDRHKAGVTMADEPTLDLAQVDLTMLPSDTEDAHEKAVSRFMTAVDKDQSCPEYEKDAGKVGTARYTRVGLIRPSETPGMVRPLILALHKGEMSKPLKLETVYRFFIVCERTEAANGLPTREELKHRMEEERLDLLAVRYLRDLRRTAFVEVRL